MPQKDLDAIEAERKALDLLKSLGYEILDLNVNYPRIGELDIVCMDKSTLVIVEVKHRANKDFGHPIEAVTPSKIKKIIKSTELYLLTFRGNYKSIRFDVVTSLAGVLEHHKGAFYGRWS
ncbi:MAG: YraN family protein [Bacillota bacterium]